MLKDHEVSPFFILWLKIVAWILVLWLVAYVCDKPVEVDSKPKCVWKNIDPSRRMSEISSYDYNTFTVTYADPAPPYRGRPSHSVTYSRGVTLQTGLSSEEILEQLNLDYEDVRDYFGDELY